MIFMKRIAGAAALGVALLLGLPSAQAGYVVTLTEQNGNVVATGSGPIDLTGLTLADSIPQAGGFLDPPPGPVLLIGPTAITPTDIYTPIAQSTGRSIGVCPGPFCTGFVADSGSGDLVGIFGGTALVVPGGYVSGSPLLDSSTWLNRTFADFGLTPGKHVWSWGTGEGNQNFTLIIGASAGPGPIPGPITVPEPASAALLGVALAGLLLAGTIRRVQNGA